MTPRLVSSTQLLRRLEWRLEHEVENQLIGDYHSVYRGRGMEFDQVVKYQFGDDIRDIDWNVTARLGEPYRKKFIEERELVVMLVIDETGRVIACEVAKSSNEEFKEPALAAVRNWVFSPAQVAGKPVRALVSIPLQFSAES